MTSLAVVMPVLNGAAFIDRAVRSVLEQAGDVDLVIVDGGSTDDTLERLAPFRERLRVFQFACNQAEAINAGVRAARGDVIAILNADDWFLPEAFDAVARAFATAAPSVGVVVGGAFVADRTGAIVGSVAAVPVDEAALARRCEIVQPAAFVRRDAFERAGGMDDANEYTCDYDLWIRLARRVTFLSLPQELAVTREHAGNKSTRNRRGALVEAARVLRAAYGYVPYPWVYHYLRVAVPARVPTPLVVASSLVAGILANARAPGRYVREWSSFRTLGFGRASTD